MKKSDDAYWPKEPNEFRKAIDDELEKLLVLGLVEIIGKDKNGDDLYVATEEGRKMIQSLAVIDFGKDEEFPK